jgi:hypothetical protein
MRINRLPTDSRPFGSRQGRSPLSPLLLIVFLVVLLAVVAIVLINVQPGAAAQVADRVRGLVGPRPVAIAEDAFYRVADLLNRTRYHLAGGGPGWHLESPSEASASAAYTTVANGANTPAGPVRPVADPQTQLPGSGARAAQGGTKWVVPTSAQLQAVALTPTPLPTAAPPEALISLTPLLTSTQVEGEGIWTPLPTDGEPPNSSPLLWKTVFRPDPERPFAQVALVAMDLSRSRLHIMVGTEEPVSAMPAAGLRTGVIPSVVQKSGQLLAAFNGGFRAIHGHYGMMTDGVVWLPAQSGLATVAVGPGGSTDLGVWGHRINPQAKWQSWRQNNPPLIENGQINPDVQKYADTIRWGASVDGGVSIWRSGLGMTAGRRWLIYAVGNSLSVSTLTTALNAAHCADAMQLDVNAGWEQFVTFQKATAAATPTAGNQLSLKALRLIDAMNAGPTQFLTPDARDFFYLTAN